MPQQIQKNSATNVAKRVWFTSVAENADSNGNRSKLSGSLTFTVRVLKAGGTSTAGAGTVTQPDSVNAPGVRYYTPAAADLDDEGVGTFVITAATMLAREVPFDIHDRNHYSAINAGLSALPSVAHSTAGGLPTVGTGVGQLSVDGTTGAVVANTTKWKNTEVAVPTLAGVPEVDVTMWNGTAVALPTTAGVPRVDVKEMEANTLTAAALATDAVTEIAAGIATSVWDFAVEGSYTARQYMRLIASSTVWKVSGFLTNLPRFRDAADTKNRISGTTTSDGRTVVTVDAT